VTHQMLDNRNILSMRPISDRLVVTGRRTTTTTTRTTTTRNSRRRRQPGCSLNHAECSLSHDQCSLNHVNCSLNHVNCSQVIRQRCRRAPAVLLRWRLLRVSVPSVVSLTNQRPEVGSCWAPSLASSSGECAICCILDQSEA
jgi:hypothetical protein